MPQILRWGGGHMPSVPGIPSLELLKNKTHVRWVEEELEENKNRIKIYLDNKTAKS